MNEKTLLEIQALLDGELSGAERTRVEALLASNPQARAWAGQLEATSRALRTHLPAATVTDSREFYWSQIQRRMAADERAAQRSTGRPAVIRTLLRWLTPALALAAIAVMLQVSGPGTPVAAQASSIVFASDADQVTIHWLD